MQPIINMLQKYQAQFETFGTVVIGFLVVIFVIICTAKSVIAFGKGNRKEGLQNLGWGAIVILIGLVSWGGLKLVITSIAPSSDILPRG